MVPLIPHLRGIRNFAEPCAGDGALIRHLEEFGLSCVFAGDIRNGQDALALNSYGAADAIITNPPWSREVLHGLITHFPEHRADVAAVGRGLEGNPPGDAVPAPLFGHRGDWPGEMDRGFEAHRQGQHLLVLVRFEAYGRPRLSLARPGRGDPFKAHQIVRAMRQALRAVATFQFAVLLTGVQAERLAQEA